MDHWILNEAREPVPVDFERFVRWKTHHPEAARVGYEQLTPTVFVSTVFFGRNMDVRRDAFPDLNLPPLLFETCAFDGDEIIDMGRAYTWEESKEQHQVVVTRMRAREAAKQRAANN